MYSSTVYLAGPIGGCSYEGCTSWRAYAATRFMHAGIITFSPMRGKTFLQREESIDRKEYAEPLATPKGIVARDRMDTQNCDLLFINLLGASSVSKGSCIEIGWADALQTPIVLAMEDEGNVHESPMIRQLCAFILPNLDDAIDTAIQVLLP